MRLRVAQEEDLTDLAMWSDDHAVSESGQVFEPVQIDELQNWLNKVMESTETYPIEVPVPEHLGEILKGVIEDWCEVLAAHGDAFETQIIGDAA